MAVISVQCTSHKSISSKAVVEGSVTGVRKAGPGTKSKIELESRMLALGNFLRFLFKKTDSQVLSLPLSAIS
jgi:hypothetical protein